MTKHRISSNGSQSLKRKRVAAFAEDNILTSEDDDGAAVVDAINVNICDMLDEPKVPTTTSTSDSIRALGETLRNTLMEINEIRERNRERRHKELLELLTKLNHDEAVQYEEPTNRDQTDANRPQQEHELSEQYIIDSVSTEADESLHIKILEAPTRAPNAHNKLQKVDPPKLDGRVELLLMREQMIEMQRQKMEKRLERRKRGNIYKHDLISPDK